jgi:hypothetical protein
MSNSPARPSTAWLAAGLGVIACGALVSVALAAPHLSAPRDAGGSALAPTASELALKILPRPQRAQTELSERFCAHIRLVLDLRCRPWAELFND